jgi:hypothetical protein
MPSGGLNMLNHLAGGLRLAVPGQDDAKATTRTLNRRAGPNAAASAGNKNIFHESS